MSPGGDIIGVLPREIVEKLKPFPISLASFSLLRVKLSTYKNVGKNTAMKCLERMMVEKSRSTYC
jgi:hypothetical protein